MVAGFGYVSPEELADREREERIREGGGGSDLSEEEDGRHEPTPSPARKGKGPYVPKVKDVVAHPSSSHPQRTAALICPLNSPLITSHPFTGNEADTRRQNSSTEKVYNEQQHDDQPIQVCEDKVLVAVRQARRLG